MNLLLFVCLGALVSTCAGVTYEIVVYTGSSWGAGTDASVSITLNGKYDSATVRLSGSGDAFDRTSVDRFSVNSNTNIGPLVSISVKNDGSGRYSPWYLEKVEVKGDNDFVEFVAKSWIYTTSKTFKAIICGQPSAPTSRIVGGNQATEGAWPWQVAIAKTNYRHWCGGSIVSKRWIVSAAHCFHDDQNKNNYKITVGQHYLNRHDSYEKTMKIEKLILHKRYASSTNDYDIALIKLSEDITYNSRVSPICLPENKVPANTNCYVSGWGALFEDGPSPNALHEAKVPIVDWRTCYYSYRSIGHYISSRMLCAGFAKGGIDSCQGDSGGPLVCKDNNRWYLSGAVSWGVGCAQAGAYGVYADVVELRPWLLDTMSNN